MIFLSAVMVAVGKVVGNVVVVNLW